MKIDLATVVNDFNDVDNSTRGTYLVSFISSCPNRFRSGNLEASHFLYPQADTILKDELYPGHYPALAKMLWKRN